MQAEFGLESAPLKTSEHTYCQQTLFPSMVHTVAGELQSVDNTPSNFVREAPQETSQFYLPEGLLDL